MGELGFLDAKSIGFKFLRSLKKFQNYVFVIKPNKKYLNFKTNTNVSIKEQFLKQF